MAQYQQRNRLCFTFEMDQKTISDSTKYNDVNNDDRRHSITTTGDRLYLNDIQDINRRYSSELSRTTVLPKVSISKAKSDILLTTINSDIGDNNNENQNLDVKKKFETSRTNATLKKLVSYINIKPRLKYKEHDYQRMTDVLNIKSTKCHICSEAIYFHCYECVQCKLTGHKKCLQSLYVKCPNKTMPPRLAMFGLEISNNNQISEVLLTCIMEIEKRPIHKLRGIYKNEGNQTIIENLCLSFEFGSHLIDLSQINPHDIAGVIKEYLNKISTPIFSQSLQKELITIVSEWPVRKVPYTQSGIAILIFELRRLVGSLGPTYRNNLAYLIYHLKKIVDRQNITEMTANSLGLVFAPVIFRNERKYNHDNKNNGEIWHKKNGNIVSMNGVQILPDVHLKIRVIELMIYYANDIFSNFD